MSGDESQRRFREFLYIDDDRVRSLLAQIDGGIVEKVVERQSDRTGSRWGGKVLGLEGSREKLGEDGTERTRNLDDMQFALFEVAAEMSGLIATIPELADANAWATDSVRGRLLPGQLVKVSAPALILDPPHVQSVLMRALAATEAYARFQEAIDPTPMPAKPPAARSQSKAKDLEQWHEDVVEIRMSATLGIPLAGAAAAGAMLSKLLGDTATVRIFPCGAEHEAYVLGGPLAEKPEFFRDDRTNLFAKYGLEPSEWTVVAQIANVPASPTGQLAPLESADASDTPPAEAAHVPPADDDQTIPQESEPDDLSRAEMGNVALEFLKTMAEAGLTDSPRYPAITISVLAIYREVPQPQNAAY